MDSVQVHIQYEEYLVLVLSKSGKPESGIPCFVLKYAW